MPSSWFLLLIAATSVLADNDACGFSLLGKEKCGIVFSGKNCTGKNRTFEHAHYDKYSQSFPDINSLVVAEGCELRLCEQSYLTGCKETYTNESKPSLPPVVRHFNDYEDFHRYDRYPPHYHPGYRGYNARAHSMACTCNDQSGRQLLDSLRCPGSAVALLRNNVCAITFADHDCGGKILEWTSGILRNDLDYTGRSVIVAAGCQLSMCSGEYLGKSCDHFLDGSVPRIDHAEEVGDRLGFHTSGMCMCSKVAQQDSKCPLHSVALKQSGQCAVAFIEPGCIDYVWHDDRKEKRGRYDKSTGYRFDITVEFGSLIVRDNCEVTMCYNGTCVKYKGGVHEDTAGSNFTSLSCYCDAQTMATTTVAPTVESKASSDKDSDDSSGFVVPLLTITAIAVGMYIYLLKNREAATLPTSTTPQDVELSQSTETTPSTSVDLITE